MPAVQTGERAMELTLPAGGASPETAASAGGHPAAPPTWSNWVLPVVVPVVLIALILGADLAEGPKTAFVGVLAVIPMLAAVFGTPTQTAITGGVAWLAALTFGHFASDGNVGAQWVRLVIIALSAVVAVFAARLREQRERELADAQTHQAVAERLKLDANTDVLTGLLNRRGIIAALEQLDRTAGPFTVVIADCDNFKQVNDAFGHTVGDEYLKVTARRLEHALATEDTLGRWGGDEFLMVLPLTATRTAEVLERVARQVVGPLPDSAEPDRAVSLTFGVAEWHSDENLDSVVLRADRAMFAGKGTQDRVRVDLS